MVYNGIFLLKVGRYTYMHSCIYVNMQACKYFYEITILI